MRTIIFTTILLLFSAAGHAQQIGCVDKSLRVQGEQIKQDFKAQGMEVYKDAMLTMVPKQPYPIAVQLSQNEIYQFVFVGMAGSDITLELFDGSDKKMAEHTVQGKTSNVMVYSFKPEKPDLYLLVLTQKIKGKKEVCGSFSIMKAGANSNTNNNGNNNNRNNNNQR